METKLENRATIHQRVRKQHSAEVAQDYVEAIHEILSTSKEVTISSLQKIFGVSHVTVIRTLQRLEEQALISSSRSKEIKLTQKGKHLAESAAAKHQLIKEFFVSLGVREEQADADAEGAEHHLSEETIDAMRKFLNTP